MGVLGKTWSIHTGIYIIQIKPKLYTYTHACVRAETHANHLYPNHILLLNMHAVQAIFQPRATLQPSLHSNCTHIYILILIHVLFIFNDNILLTIPLIIPINHHPLAIRNC